MPKALDLALTEAVLRDIRARQKSCRQIGRDHGISPTTVSKIARDAGIDDAFGRANVARAHAARVTDQRALRGQRLAALGALADDMVERGSLSYQVIASGPDGPEKVTLDKPPLREAEAAGRTMRNWLDAQLMIERHEGAGQQLSAFDEWMRTMAGDGDQAADRQGES